MNKKLKKKWTTALKSGKYLQTRGTLIGTAYSEEDEYGLNDPLGTGYCCLGVLCEVDPNVVWHNETAYSIHPKLLKRVRWLYEHRNDDDDFSEEDMSLLDLYSPIKDAILIGNAEFEQFFQKFYGLDRIVKDGDKGKRPMMSKLIGFNDDRHFDFNKIARYVEKVKI